VNGKGITPLLLQSARRWDGGGTARNGRRSRPQRFVAAGEAGNGNGASPPGPLSLTPQTARRREEGVNGKGITPLLLQSARRREEGGNGKERQAPRQAVLTCLRRDCDGPR